MLHIKVHGNRSAGSKEEDIKVSLYHIWARKPSGHVTNIFAFPCTLKLTYKIWSKKVKWFLRNTSFNIRDDVTMQQS